MSLYQTNSGWAKVIFKPMPNAYLLDANVFIWIISDPTRISSSAAAVASDKSNRLLLSLSTVWEIQIKAQLGKLTFPAPLGDILDKQMEINQIELIALRLDYILKLGELPNHHRDPFDRLLIAQALVEDLTIISSDPMFRQYNVSVLW
ncbi:MAG: type II toxin-antitoxin system VapC family toxin [bacterium]|nr:type II toxin-antitoxin system VapC family toxin [bacterium]